MIVGLLKVYVLKPADRNSSCQRWKLARQIPKAIGHTRSIMSIDTPGMKSYTAFTWII